MADEEPPRSERELDPDRCPNCNGPLRVIADIPERLCPACEIFVEFLQPLATEQPRPEEGPDAVARRLEVARLHLTFETFDEGPERGREQKDVTPEGPPGPDTPVAEAGPAPEPVPPPPSPEEPSLEPPAALLPPAKELKALPPAEVPPTPSEPEPEAAPPSEPVVPPLLPTETPAPPVPPGAPGPTVPAAPASPWVEAEPAVGEKEFGEEETVEAYECPRCQATVEPDAKKCPECGTLFGVSVPTQDVPFIVGLPPPKRTKPEHVERAPPRVAAAVAKAGTAERALRPSRADRAIFYVGAANVALGGWGLMLGSFLHDFFRVPFMGYAYDAFRSLNLIAV